MTREESDIEKGEGSGADEASLRVSSEAAVAVASALNEEVRPDEYEEAETDEDSKKNKKTASSDEAALFSNDVLVNDRKACSFSSEGIPTKVDEDPAVSKREEPPATPNPSTEELIASFTTRPFPHGGDQSTRTTTPSGNGAPTTQTHILGRVTVTSNDSDLRRDDYVVSSPRSEGIVGAYAVGGPGFERDHSPVEAPPAVDEQPSNAGTETVTGDGYSSFGDLSDLIEATLVEDDSMPRTQPGPVVEAEPVLKMSKMKRFLLGSLVLVAVVSIAVAISQSLRSKDDDDDGSANSGGSAALNGSMFPVPLSPSPSVSPTATPIPMLQRIRREGILRCGLMTEAITSIFSNIPGAENTFEAEICRAIAAAIVGRDNYQVEFIPIELENRVQKLEEEAVDVVIAALSWTMDRDVYVPDHQNGLGFAAVYTTLSSGFAGKPEYVACAQDGVRYVDECADMNICVLNGTRFFDTLAHKVPRGQLHLVDGYADFFPAYKDGTCNVMASTFIDLNMLALASAQDGEEFVSSDGYWSNEPLSIVTREEDRQFMDFCNYVMLSLFAAEYHNITSQNVLQIHQDNNTRSSLPKFQRPTSFGKEYKDMFIDAVATSGNYEEMRKKRVNPVMLPREAVNHVNNGATGIIHSLPFGLLTTEGPSLDMRFEDVWNRGRLRCAIRTVDRPGFAERIDNSTETASYSGMDVDYCLIIAASIFNARLDKVDFVEVQNDTEGFDILHKGEVDVLAGVTSDLARDVKDPQTGVGFSFTKPYFYNSTADGTQREPDANLCLATREDLTGWSEYVFWIVQATFYAEEESITRFTANEMPTVELYGERFTRIFRDAISAVGNYGEIYRRNVQQHIPRQGMNQLHDKSNPTPLFYIPPGIF